MSNEAEQLSAINRGSCISERFNCNSMLLTALIVKGALLSCESHVSYCVSMLADNSPFEW